MRSALRIGIRLSRSILIGSGASVRTLVGAFVGALSCWLVLGDTLLIALLVAQWGALSVRVRASRGDIEADKNWRAGRAALTSLVTVSIVVPTLSLTLGLALSNAVGDGIRGNILIGLEFTLLGARLLASWSTLVRCHLYGDWRSLRVGLLIAVAVRRRRGRVRGIGRSALTGTRLGLTGRVASAGWVVGRRG